MAAVIRLVSIARFVAALVIACAGLGAAGCVQSGAPPLPDLSPTSPTSPRAGRSLSRAEQQKAINDMIAAREGSKGSAAGP